MDNNDSSYLTIEQHQQQSYLLNNNCNNNINHSQSQNSTSSGYCSGRSTPNMLNRLNQTTNSKLYTQQAAQLNVNNNNNKKPLNRHDAQQQQSSYEQLLTKQKISQSHSTTALEMQGAAYRSLSASNSGNLNQLNFNDDISPVTYTTTPQFAIPPSSGSQLNYDERQQQQYRQRSLSMNRREHFDSVSSTTGQFNRLKELNMKIIDMQKEIQYLKYELDLNVSKLQSSIHSIKTFWSPELKRERILRKEETIKYQNLYDKYKILLNNKNFQANEQNGQADGGDGDDEVNYLKKTIFDLELRIDTQKHILVSKDDTIKYLFLLISNCYDNNILSGENCAVETPLMAYNEELQRIFNEQQFLMEQKLDGSFDGTLQRVKYLENQNQMLQDELKGLTQSNSATQATQNQFELFKSNERFYKEKFDSLKQELNRKDNELQGYKTKYESIESKEKDLQHYLSILKETLSTKEQQISIINSEVADLRTRLRDRETNLEKKQQQLQTFQIDKHQRDSDICELKDQMEIKDRKLNVLYRKIENLEEQIKDKEAQAQTLRSKLNIFQTTTNIASGNLMESSLTESVINGDKILTSSLSSKSLVKDELSVTLQELKEINEKKDKEILEYQNEILDFKDEINILKTQLIHKDSHVNSLELSLTQKNDEMEEMQDGFNRMKQQLIDTFKKQIKDLQKEMHSKEVKLTETQNELNILKELINNFEKQKEDMFNKLEQQQNSFDDLLIKYEEQINLNSNSHKNANNTNNTAHLGRIRELEDALRQSVAITAEREYAMAKQRTRGEKLEHENRQLTSELGKIKKHLNEQQCVYDRLNEDFVKREEQLEKLEHEKVKEMNDLLIAKQEALLGAISEKDANIARLEELNQINEASHLYDEKDELHQKLKELNEKRMKLMQHHQTVKDAKHKVQMLVLNIANSEDGLYQ